MKTTLFVLLISSCSINISTKCSDLKTGKFKLVSEESGTTIITRTAKEQVEINKDFNVKVRYKVKWLNACTYQLFDAKIYEGDDYFEGKKTDTLTVKITEISNDFYKISTTSNFSDLSLEVKLAIIK
ncbi:MAG: hypothetical protein COC01_07815 [Bacteroidetes bacterium]|nr:MAG: hypothetical protein COC01_07815 [Bacteroidota bacterium]